MDVKQLQEAYEWYFDTMGKSIAKSEKLDIEKDKDEIDLILYELMNPFWMRNDNG